VRTTRPDDELKQQYMKAVDRLTFLTTPELVADYEEAQRLRKELQEQQQRLAKLEAVYTERLALKAYE
jgi:arginine deiminase